MFRTRAGRYGRYVYRFGKRVGFVASKYEGKANRAYKKYKNFRKRWK